MNRLGLAWVFYNLRKGNSSQRSRYKVSNESRLSGDFPFLFLSFLFLSRNAFLLLRFVCLLFWLSYQCVGLSNIVFACWRYQVGKTDMLVVWWLVRFPIFCLCIWSVFFSSINLQISEMKLKWIFIWIFSLFLDFYIRKDAFIILLFLHSPCKPWKSVLVMGQNIFKQFI